MGTQAPPLTRIPTCAGPDWLPAILYSARIGIRMYKPPKGALHVEVIEKPHKGVMVAPDDLVQPPYPLRFWVRRAGFSTLPCDCDFSHRIIIGSMPGPWKAWCKAVMKHNGAIEAYTCIHQVRFL